MAAPIQELFPKWIPVEAALPEDGVVVGIIIKDPGDVMHKTVAAGYYYSESKMWTLAGTSFTTGASHWCRLPCAKHLGVTKP